jgi:hypothetical protein
MSAISGASNPRDAQKSRSGVSGASFSRLSRSIWANADSFGAGFLVVVMWCVLRRSASRASAAVV